MQNLTLIIPGLLGPDARFSDDYVPTLPALELLLSRSRHSKEFTHAYHRTLAYLLALNVSSDRDVPVAAITRFMDNDEDTEGIWIRSDPVHLSPDRDGLILMDSFILNLNQHDSLAIASVVNQVLLDYGYTVEVPYEDRWYIQLEEELSMTTTELSSVVGSEITAFLPRGNDAGKIHSMLNEVQMQLFNSDINHKREDRGELPVNSIWLWGMGALGDTSHTELNVMFTDEVFSSCLAGLTSTVNFPVPQHFLGMQDHCEDSDEVMAVLMQCQAPSQYQNLELWRKAILLLEGSWFAPALERLEQGKLGKLRIISDTHEFLITRTGLRKFWRKPTSISQFRQSSTYAKNG